MTRYSKDLCKPLTIIMTVYDSLKQLPFTYSSYLNLGKLLLVDCAFNITIQSTIQLQSYQDLSNQLLLVKKESALECTSFAMYQIESGATPSMYTVMEKFLAVSFRFFGQTFWFHKYGL